MELPRQKGQKQEAAERRLAETDKGNLPKRGECQTRELRFAL